MKKKQNIIFLLLSILIILTFITSCTPKTTETVETATSSVLSETTQETQVKQTIETSIKYPEPISFVNDYVGFFTEDEITQMESYLKDFEKKTTTQIVIVTVKSLEGLTVDKYAYELFNTWGIGKAGKNNGVLLLISPEKTSSGNRPLRIEVGTGLENTITDAVASQILKETIVPYLNKGEFGKGCFEGVKAIAEKILSSQ